MRALPLAARRYPLGAELTSTNRASFRVWAADLPEVEVVVDGVPTPLRREEAGWFSAVTAARVGSRYGFRLPGADRVYPDPASWWLPDGPDGLSAIVDLSAYEWHDASWRGVQLSDQVLYELHVGTFTPEGTWRAAERWLPRLRALGVTVIQMMPVAEFAGRFGWGYDGVQWFAPKHVYGTPVDLQHFVDAAHQLGLGVILDVVYHHLGPSGNFHDRFTRHWHGTRHANEVVMTA